MWAFFNFCLYLSALEAGTTSSSFENSKWRFLQFFSTNDKSLFSLNPPTKSSACRLLSKGGQTKYTDMAFLRSLFSERYFTRKTPQSEEPTKIYLPFKRVKYRLKNIFQSLYFALSCRGIRGVIISNLFPKLFSLALSVSTISSSVISPRSATKSRIAIRW